ncbi:hypothetical protein LWI28_005731 [Acer negundo]|uniref:Uncharacterized protein n=1 Tax=Acer negundo TaxID=4023 RepID=A0AAD5P176_ACENE|nr:hypothetical protein LWI28_005731 [Acer negundo]
MVVSDNIRIGFEEINFGWGKPMYGGLAEAISFISFYVKFQKISDGKIGKLVPIWLPPLSMVRGLVGAVSFISFYAEYQKISDGEIGKLIPIWLPPSSMVRFEQE